MQSDEEEYTLGCVVCIASRWRAFEYLNQGKGGLSSTSTKGRVRVLPLEDLIDDDE
jgi:hypothetical protein